MGLSLQYSIFFVVSFCEIRTRINYVSVNREKVSMRHMHVPISNFEAPPQGNLQNQNKRYKLNEEMALQI